MLYLACMESLPRLFFACEFTQDSVLTSVVHIAEAEQLEAEIETAKRKRRCCRKLIRCCGCWMLRALGNMEEDAKWTALHALSKLAAMPPDMDEWVVESNVDDSLHTILQLLKRAYEQGYVPTELDEAACVDLEKFMASARAPNAITYHSQEHKDWEAIMQLRDQNTAGLSCPRCRLLASFFVAVLWGTSVFFVAPMWGQVCIDPDFVWPGLGRWDWLQEHLGCPFA